MTNPLRGPNGTWWKIGTFFLPLLVGAIIAFTRVQGQVSTLERDVAKKADAAVMEANQQAILRELNEIQATLRKHIP